ncbi:hypothetical protein SUGI_0522410 [Cryptomeria japonica]|nr:hypothetical protein SUGI_0522410 [Cryptomeria japonica]
MNHIVKFLSKYLFVVIFTFEEEKERILQGGVWALNDLPLYIKKWHPNFNPAKLNPYDKLDWIRVYNLPIEYWLEEYLEKIGKSMGTLMEIDVQVAEGDSFLYAHLKLATVRTILRKSY